MPSTFYAATWKNPPGETMDVGPGKPRADFQLSSAWIVPIEQSVSVTLALEMWLFAANRKHCCTAASTIGTHVGNSVSDPYTEQKLIREKNDFRMVFGE